MKIFIGSSYFEGGKGGPEFRRAFAHHWYYNTMAASPDKVAVICEGGSVPPRFAKVDYVNLTGDLGHCEGLIEKAKRGLPHPEFAGWSASMCALAMLAYVDGATFVYKEEDALAFGPWLQRMKQDLGNADLVFGPKMKSAPWMPAAQSLFMVRHSAIPWFVRTYLSLGGDDNASTLGEHKFCAMESKFPQRCRRLSFGCDREKPIPWDSDCFYAQQWTQAELEEAKRRNLL